MPETLQQVNSLEETAHLAAEIARALKGGESVGFSGELGAGKTTLIRSLVQALGFTKPVSSPTYVLHHEYLLPDGKVIDHWDLYRLSSLPEDLYEPCPLDHIRLIEWPERVEGFISQLDKRISISYSSDDPLKQERTIMIVHK